MVLYDIRDRRNAIREVQTYLLAISYESETIPAVAIDGVYESRTRTAVEIFQKEQELPVTGYVDYETWKLLYTAYEKTEEKNAAEAKFGTVSLLPGDRGHQVEELQHMLRYLSFHYATLPQVEVSSVYTYETEEAVYHLQEIYGMEPDSEIDTVFFAQIERDYRDKKQREARQAL